MKAAALPEELTPGAVLYIDKNSTGNLLLARARTFKNEIQN